MIAQAGELAAAPHLNIDAVRELQRQWQAEAQSVPMDRRHEQKLWDAFRKPLDEAFARKTQQRERVAQQLSARDQAVLDASKALEAANHSDAQQIQNAIEALQAALKAQSEQPAPAAAAAEDLLLRKLQLSQLLKRSQPMLRLPMVKLLLKARAKLLPLLHPHPPSPSP